MISVKKQGSFEVFSRGVEEPWSIWRDGRPFKQAWTWAEVDKILGGGEIAAKTPKKRSHATIGTSPYGHELFKTNGKPKPEIIARRKTADDKSVSLWNDGSLTWGPWNAIKGSPNPKTDAQIREALAAGWLVMGEVELYDADDVPRLIEVARKVARRGGGPGDVRAAFAEASPLRPHWTVLETDRDGRPKLRVWKLPRMTHPGIAVWDYMGVRGRGRYHVMQEMLERGRRGGGTYAPTGFDFNDLKALGAHLRSISQL